MKDSEITYRNGTIEDVHQLAELRVQFLNELESHESESETKELNTQLKDYFAKAFLNKSIVVRVAAIGNEIIATSTMVIWQMPIGYSGIRKNGKGYILNMYTLPEYRKKGICTRLLDDLKNIAIQMKLHHIHLHATEDGLSLYKKVGFVIPKYPELTMKLK